MENKRKYIRVKEYHLLKYKVRNERETLSFVRNIGAGGVMFNGKEELEEGTVIDLSINFPEYEHPIDVVAKIVWCLPHKTFEGFDIGAEFVQIDDADRAFIDEMMQKAPEEDLA